MIDCTAVQLCCCSFLHVLQAPKIMHSLMLQCDELNWGHPSSFSQPQDKLRTKELDLLHQQLNLPLAQIGLLTKKSNSFVLNLSCGWLIIFITTFRKKKVAVLDNLVLEAVLLLLTLYYPFPGK